jgi:hypothetical protein
MVVNHAIRRHPLSTASADRFREPGFSKERRLEPQMSVGLLTNAKAAHQLSDVTVGL